MSSGLASRDGKEAHLFNVYQRLLISDFLLRTLLWGLSSIVCSSRAWPR